ncbi:efflux RND transporter periplasmic adaptor subunit [Methylobacterium sp. NEAU K]|uniref:efflux RND transporter periplasmic adaptor subunit n=1 Tax=Methylobacterium sp. NEAU K TaxID=3064946 RepID=UPI0027362292|nr:efflux RND transporter periplasmic adaptor subunit [Methylobacterium sp. NEAU K]MDP4006548.1 efflux RND transporter periplasmic adaptor subunit [Methylobacterium sp. NEAU K]
MLLRIRSEPIPGHERVGVRTQSQLTGTVAILVLFITFTGCQDKQAASSAHTAVTAPAVSIIVAEPKAVTLVKELPGRITPMRIAEVRPRVSGIIIKQTFEQGSLVKEGTVLYHIDPKPFEVELDAAKAALARADATLFQANRQEDRLRQLLSGQTTTQAQYDLALAAEKQAEADVAAQKAAVQRAQLNLDFATLRAPITGRIGRALVTEGALVGQNEATHLATIQQLDPIYADFTQSVTELNQLKRDLSDGRLQKVSPNAAKVRLVFDDGTLYPHSGRLLFSDVTVDPGTGQVILRGEFPNPSAELLPGTYMRVQIEEGIDADAIVLPQQAIQRNNAGGSEVYVVNDEGRAVLQPVRVGRTLGNEIVVEDGLKPGYRVVVEGFQKFRPGSVVQPVPWVPAKQAAAQARPN